MASSEAGKDLVCGICQDVYSDPKLLPCSHTFCLACLQKLTSDQEFRFSFPCPKCRQNIPVPRHGVRGFNNNIYITGEELNAAKGAQQSTKCPIHAAETLVFVCVRCDQTLCVRCKLTKHEGHETEDLSDAAARCKGRLNSKVSEYRQKSKKLGRKVSATKADINDIRTAAGKAKQQMQSRLDELIARAIKVADEVKGEIDEMTNSLLQEAEAKLQAEQRSLNAYKDLIQRAKNARDSACSAAVVSMEREFRQRGKSKKLEPEPGSKFSSDFLPHLQMGEENSLSQSEIRSFIGSVLKKKRPGLFVNPLVLMSGRYGSSKSPTD